MTVEEIGWFTAGFYGPGFLPEYAKLVAQFGLPPKKKLKALSKGTRAKVALSLALAHQPELLVSGRAHLRPRRDGPPRVPGKHGRSRLAGPNRLPVEPSDRRGRAGGRHRGDPSQGKTAAGRAARRTQGPGEAADLSRSKMERPQRRPSAATSSRSAGSRGKARRSCAA